MREDEAAGGLALPLAWIGLDELPIHMANQFLSQIDQDGTFILSIGQVAPPALLGTPEEQRAQASVLPFVAVRPIARYSLSPQRMKELTDLLQRMLAALEAAQTAGEQL